MGTVSETGTSKPNRPSGVNDIFLHVVDVKHIEGYKIEVAFSDGRKGVADLGGSFRGSVFEPLRDIDFFAKVAVDRELETVVWPNGVDFAPEFLYFKAFGNDPRLKSQFESWGYKAEQAA